MVSVPAPLLFQYMARSHIIPLPEVGLLTTPMAVPAMHSSAVEKVMHDHAGMVQVLTALENTEHRTISSIIIQGLMRKNRWQRTGAAILVSFCTG